MMQMLVAGGMTPLSDGERRADVDNPRGYLEWERIKQLPCDPDCIAEAEGKVVKVISRLLFSLSARHHYRVIFMQRAMAEVLASQDEMLRRRASYKSETDVAAMASAFENHLRKVDAWLGNKHYVKTLRVPHRDALNEPTRIAREVSEFLQLELDVDAMEKQVDCSLYRNRAG